MVLLPLPLLDHATSVPELPELESCRGYTRAALS